MYTSNKGKERSNYAQGWGGSLPFIRGWVLCKLVSPVHVGLCELLKFRSPRSSICFSFTFLWAVELGREVLIVVSELCCVKKIAIRWADRRNNKHGGLERRSNKYKGREKGGKGDRLDAELWSSLYAEPLRLQPPVSLETTPPSFFFVLRKLCLPASSGDTNTASWQLSKAFCQMTLAPWLFCRIRDRFSYVFFSFFITTTKTFTQLFKMFSLMTSSLVNYVCASSFP